MAIDVAVVGAAGYAGAELVRRLLEHPEFNLVTITSDSDAGTPLSSVYPSFKGVSDLVFSEHSDERIKACDAAFLAVPHTAAMAVVPELLDAGVSVFDLSADYRLKDAEVYEQWYGVAHTSPELLNRVAFGQPEICGGELAQAAEERAGGSPVLVACAGCYPTASSLAAYPAVSAGWVQGQINIQAISGVTGAGRSANARTHFCSANEDVEAYGVGVHRHTPEIEQILGNDASVLFIPHLAPLNRGLLSTVTMQLSDSVADDFDTSKAIQAYRDFYDQSAFVHVLDEGVQPRTDSVAGSNHAHVGVVYVPRNRTLVATCAIDNLCKGAAGQAVQCANIVFGFPEDTGLRSITNPV